MNADRIDQETAERLLGGAVVPSAGPRPVVLLLTAVRAAPSPAELAGEGVAVRAFHRERQSRVHAKPIRHAAGSDPLAVPRPPARRSRTLAAFGGRAAVAALALAATGGVALAAGTGSAPRPSHPPTATPPVPAGPPAATAPATGGQVTSGAHATSGIVPPASVSAGTTALCRAFRSVSGDGRGRALDNPVFSELITAAGDRQAVPGYCARLLTVRTTPGGATAGRPGTTPGRPHPSGPQDHPSGPQDHPPTAGGPDRTAPADRRPATPERPTEPTSRRTR
ncbi:hypothetical protein [Micromonospora sp. NPDC049301]|uniref:hypothetical protein n=1 Tax=Micromonospora sp. NPDC049301 TaxID=3155723 RepID=UPI0034461F0E